MLVERQFVIPDDRTLVRLDVAHLVPPIGRIVRRRQPAITEPIFPNLLDPGRVNWALVPYPIEAPAIRDALEFVITEILKFDARPRREVLDGL